MERRRHPRKSAYIPVNIDGGDRKDRFGITRNISVVGIQFHSRSAFQIGDRLELSLHGQDVRTAGVVVRAEENDSDPFTTFPHVTAVHLEGTLPVRVFSRRP